MVKDFLARGEASLHTTALGHLLWPWVHKQQSSNWFCSAIKPQGSLFANIYLNRVHTLGALTVTGCHLSFAVRFGFHNC